MAFPTFFEAVPGIDVHDPLAYFLGASDDGILHLSLIHISEPTRPY